MARGDYFLLPDVKTYMMCFTLFFMCCYILHALFFSNETEKVEQLMEEFTIMNLIYMLLYVTFSAFIEMIQGSYFWAFLGFLNICSITHCDRLINEVMEERVGRISIQEIGNDLVIREEVFGLIDEEFRTYVSHFAMKLKFGVEPDEDIFLI